MHGGPTPLWVSTYTSSLLYKAQDPFSACRQSHGQKTFFLLNFLERTSLCFTDQETQEQNVLGGPTPSWVSTYTSHPLYKVEDPFSACRQSHGQIIFSSFNFLERTSLCFTDQETQEENVHGGPTPLWVGTYTSYLLYKDPFRACRQSCGQNTFFYSSMIKRGPILASHNTVLTKFQIHSAHVDSLMAETLFPPSIS